MQHGFTGAERSGDAGHPAACDGKERIDDAGGRYIEFCKSTVPSTFELTSMKIVVDCAHGATYHVAPSVFRELGADIVEVGTEPDGLNINDGVGSTSPQKLADTVVSNGADLGVAFDGDGDRLGTRR